MDDIYNMKLHEYTNSDKTTKITRVPGGWIYESILIGFGMTSVFVPWHDSDHDLLSNRNHEDLKRELKECYLTIEKLSAKLKKAELALFQIDAVKYNPEGIRSALKEYIDNKST